MWDANDSGPIHARQASCCAGLARRRILYAEPRQSIIRTDMSDTTHDDFAISSALAREQKKALELVLGEVPAAQRTADVAQLIEAERSGQIDLGGLLVARQRGELVGAVWGQSQPGRTASVWPPAVVDNRAKCQDALMRELTAWLTQRDVCVAQTLLTGESAEQVALLAQHGFVHLADLLYMVCLSAHFSR